MDFDQEAEEVSRLRIKLESLRESLEREGKEVGKAKTYLESAKQAQDILQHLSQAVQQKAHSKIAEVVSTCLSAVFADPYKLSIDFERKRGRTEAHLSFKRDGNTLDPLNSTGGGAVDIAAFALRVASLILHRPRLSKVLVLDEPMKFVSVEYQSAVRAMLETLAKDMGIQIVFVTHQENYATGKIIEL